MKNRNAPSIGYAPLANFGAVDGNRYRPEVRSAYTPIHRTAPAKAYVVTEDPWNIGMDNIV